MSNCFIRSIAATVAAFGTTMIGYTQQPEILVPTEVPECPACGPFDFKKIPPVHYFPRQGPFPIPPSGCGSYSLQSALRGEVTEGPPKFGYPAFGLMATPFYDAQGVVDHHLFGIGSNADVRIGGGAWAGGQKGVGRVDIGPRASVSFRVKRIGVRAAVDYRARVAGHAAPGSGPALTLSAGF